MYHLPGIPETFDLRAATQSYYSQLFPLNPGGIVPVTPSDDQLGLVSLENEGRVGPVFHVKNDGVVQAASK